MCHPHSPCSASWLQGHPRVEIFPPQGLQGPPGQHSPALGAGRGSLIACVPWGCSSQGCCILRHYCININIYIYLLYIFCPGSMHGQAEGSAVLLERCSLGRGDSPLLPSLGSPSDPQTTLDRAPTPLHWQQGGDGTLHSWWWPRLSSGGPGRTCPEGWGSNQTPGDGASPVLGSTQDPGAGGGVSSCREPGTPQEHPIPGTS